ncbi:hypothetical protein Aperf_G00000112621 [Anoplocephala perfoliata]
MQYSVYDRKNFCLDGLTPGSTYQFCVAPTDCQNSWECKSFTTFEQNSVKTFLVELSVNVEGRDSNWIQLSWLPPKIKRPATPPVAYIILVRTAENCSEKALYFQAPWLSEDEKHHIQKSAEKLRGVKDCSGSGGDAELRLGDLDGYWPDFPGSRRSTWVEGWNTAEVDEQGPVGLFVTTIDNLQPNTNYKLEIWPVFYPSAIGAINMPTTLKVSTAKEDSEVVIEPKEMGVSIYHHSNYSYTISEIGAHPIHCQQVQPINTNGAAERLCIKSQQNLSSETYVPLTPGTLYRVKVNSVTKVFQIPAPQTPSPLAFVTRICKSSNDEDCRKYPLYREVIGTYSLYENRSIWRMSPNNGGFYRNVHIRSTPNSSFHVLLDAYDGDKEKLIHLNIVKTRDTSCQNWCVWPAGDWSNTRGKAFGEYEMMFARINAIGAHCRNTCLPLREAIDGETGCIDADGQMSLCNIPICTDVAQVGCVTDIQFKTGTTWIFTEWQDPREFGKFPIRYLIMITSNSDLDRCRIFIENGKSENLPPFLQTVLKSCNNYTANALLNRSSVNITNLAQNTTYNVFVIPYLTDGRIGALLKMAMMTKLAPIMKRDCGWPTSITVFMNDAVSVVNVPNMTQNASLVHNFEYCEKLNWKFDFDNSAGRTAYPFELRTHAEYPEINETFPTIYHSSGSQRLDISYTFLHHLCQYEYVLQWGIWPDMTNCEVESAHLKSIELPPLQEGLVYNFVVRVQPLGVSSKCEANKFASNWSEKLVFPTEMSKSEVKIYNKTVTSYISKAEDESGERFGCFFPQTEYSEQYEFRFAQRTIYSYTEINSFCTIVGWIVEPRSAEFILGYIFQITQPDNASCQVFWVPCEDCFPGNNLKNALPKVTNAITKIESSCLGTQSGPLENAERLNSKLYKTTTRFLMAFQTIRSQRGTFPGVLRVYVVKMASVSPIMEQIWSANSQGKFYVLSKNGVYTGIVAALVIILYMVVLTVGFVIKSKFKVVRRRDLTMQEIPQHAMAAEVDSVKKIRDELVGRQFNSTMALNATSNPIYAAVSYSQNDSKKFGDECLGKSENLPGSQSELREHDWEQTKTLEHMVNIWSSWNRQ